MPGENKHRITARAGLILATSSLLGMGFMSAAYLHSRDYIAKNERAILMQRLKEVLPETPIDNDFIHDTVTVTEPQWLGSKHALTIYRARRHGVPVAAVVESVAPDGYSGPIKLLVGIRYDGVISGVRIVEHHETPGLGDAIDSDKSHWALSFNKHSLENTNDQQWHVKKDHGEFAGATITPRAVVKSIHKALQYFMSNRERLFAEKAAKPHRGDSS
jgi:electron transport complex protein RnfG